MDPHRSSGLVQIGFFRTSANKVPKIRLFRPLFFALILQKNKFVYFLPLLTLRFTPISDNSCNFWIINGNFFPEPDAI